MGKHVLVIGGGQLGEMAPEAHLWGRKGAALVELSALGVPVPAAFVLGAEWGGQYHADGRRLSDDLKREMLAAVAAVETLMGSRFGAAAGPLLLSCRLSPVRGIPGLMDSVLNIGLNEEAVRGLIAKAGNERWAWDVYRRFVQAFGAILVGDATWTAGRPSFEDLLQEAKKRRGVRSDSELPVADLKDLVGRFKALVADATGKPFPDDPWEQLWQITAAAFDSWNGTKAEVYRKVEKIPDAFELAVVFQAMVFGNLGDASGVGVVYSRDPRTGAAEPFGDWLENAQGDEVVAGIRSPMPIGARRRDAADDAPSLESTRPGIFRELREVLGKLEKHHQTIVDVEFTVEGGRLWVLDCRLAKCAPQAAIRIARDMFREGLVDRRTAVARIDPQSIARLADILDPGAAAARTPLTRGQPVAPGAVTGRVLFPGGKPVAAPAVNDPEILVCDRLDADEYLALETRSTSSPSSAAAGGMFGGVCGIVGCRCGPTSELAFLARTRKLPCIMAAGGFEIDRASRTARVEESGVTLAEGDLVTIDGSTGNVYAGRLSTVPHPLKKEYQALLDEAAEDSPAGGQGEKA